MSKFQRFVEIIIIFAKSLTKTPNGLGVFERLNFHNICDVVKIAPIDQILEEICTFYDLFKNYDNFDKSGSKVNLKTTVLWPKLSLLFTIDLFWKFDLNLT